AILPLLPAEILVKIVHVLPIQGRSRLGSTCRRIHHIELSTGGRHFDKVTVRKDSLFSGAAINDRLLLNFVEKFDEFALNCRVSGVSAITLREIFLIVRESSRSRSFAFEVTKDSFYQFLQMLGSEIKNEF
ncbi:hypothetical protein PFISCL1PPCAC_11765, partial [Pristionchus fissidentatus]